MKHIGIITIVKVNNYGAELQAFALQHKLKLMGYKAEIIDYLFYKHPHHKKETCSKPFYPYPLKKRIKEWLLPKIEFIKSLPHRTEWKERQKGFESFHQRYTQFSTTCYHSYSELYNNPPQYDVYCVGSDQVWNPGCYTNLNPYFLSFAPENKRKISYASSFGTSKLPQIVVPQYNKLLNGLDYISVREEAGINIVKETANRTAIKVADPTLLLNQKEWRAIAKYDKVPKERYILLYVLKDSEYIKEQAKKIAKDKGIKVVRICKGAFKQDKNSDHIINITDAAPDDFLGLFDKAEMVLTNSFHGTVFSILFQKEFYTIIKRETDNNSRQISLLNTLGIDRIKYEDEQFKENPLLNWDAINTNLENYRKLSENYILKAINENE